MVVCSGACGADILALEAAAQLGLGRRLVLPFARQKFRATSVADRGEDWGLRFDAILHQLPGEHIVELNLQQSSDQAYAAANSEILDQAEGLASSRRPSRAGHGGLEWTQPGSNRPDRAIP